MRRKMYSLSRILRRNQSISKEKEKEKDQDQDRNKDKEKDKDRNKYDFIQILIEPIF